MTLEISSNQGKTPAMADVCTGARAQRSAFSRRQFLGGVFAGTGALAFGNRPVLASAEVERAPDVAIKGDVLRGESLSPIIDTHLHVVRGIPSMLKPFPGNDAERISDLTVADKAQLMKFEMEKAKVRIAFAMPCIDDPDPLGINSSLEVAAHVPGLMLIGAADPRRTSAAHLREVDALLKEKAGKEIVAFKAWVGFLGGPEDERYEPYYKLADKYKLPVIFHTGSIPSAKGESAAAHPLRVDQVARRYPSVRFVMAHCGLPWFLDAAEVAMKNDNVWMDLAGHFIGDQKIVDNFLKKKAIPDVLPGFVVKDLTNALIYMDRYDRILYGSDWPLVQMSGYRRFMEALIPNEHHLKVFQENAESVFSVKISASASTALAKPN